MLVCHSSPLFDSRRRKVRQILGEKLLNMKTEKKSEEKLLPKTRRLLAKFQQYCPYILKEHYTVTMGKKPTRRFTKKVAQDNAAGKKHMLEGWKFALEELKMLHERENTTESGLEYTMIKEEIQSFREEIQCNKELWPFLVYSWDA